MEKRNISKETQLKVLKCAAEILRLHGSIAGDRICQEWPGDDDKNPGVLFDENEKDALEYNHQIENSGLDDYDERYHNLCDEMVASFVIADAIDDIISKFV